MNNTNRQIEASTILSHYRIVSKIGEGGMGEVYLAQDTMLDRKIALKILPSVFAEDEGRMGRFVREAKSVSSLNHPNILTIHEIGEVDGHHYIATEFIAGETLRQSIDRGSLPIKKTLDIACQVAAALNAAHQAGIIHRDIKPENVMIRSDGLVKVLDFGLAKLNANAGADPESETRIQSETHPGMIVGTVAYMSPQQARGQAVDARTDIWSLGVLIYEMLSGRHPFKGETITDTLANILRRDPAPIHTTDGELSKIISKMLAKQVDARYQMIEDVAVDLKRLQRKLEFQTERESTSPWHTKKEAQTQMIASTTDASLNIPGFEGRPAIAVLPFINRSNDPEQEYFADGLAEDLITRLSLWRSFPVIAHNSCCVYKGTPVAVKQVSTDLGVRYVVEGGVRKVGNQMRISAQLIDATTGQHVWAKTYDRELTDVFAVQDEISDAIAASLVGDLQRAEHARVRGRAPDSLEAWELYHRALPLIYNFTREDCAQARALLERALRHDPHFSTALARLAEVGIWEIMNEWTDDPERSLDTAIAQARSAVALDPLDALARVSLSFALMTAGDGYGALEEARQAVELNPSMPFALAIHAHHLHIAGNSPADSIRFVLRALRLSPHDPVEWLFYDVLAGAYLNAGRFVEGLEAGRRLIALSPNYYWGYLWSAMNAVGLGQIEEARNLVREALRVKPTLSFELARKCLGKMTPDVDRRFSEALRQAGLERREQAE